MPTESRTSKSLKNAQVSLVFYFLFIIVGFWKRAVFYDYLGSEVLGLDTTAYNLLGVLNLAELGVSASVCYFLYKPLYDQDTQTINKIVALQGWIYRRIACILIIGAIILMCFFPRIFADTTLPFWYPYATFSVLLTGSLLSYFMNYRICVLEADQKAYKVVKATKLAGLIGQILLIILLPYASHPFILYLGVQTAGQFFGCYWINRTIKKEYPWLSKVENSGKELIKEFPEVIKKTKQLFIHKLTFVIVTQSEPIIMYTFVSLTQIAFYGNYVTVIGRMKDMLAQVFLSTNNGIGNLVASKDDERIRSVFWELTDSRIYLSTCILITMGLLTDPFISVWLDPDYLLGTKVLVLICISYWLTIIRQTIDGFVAGYGLFQDTWAPVLEAVINLGVAFTMGHFFGIAGVITGGICSTSIIIFGWRAYMLFTMGLKINPWKYYFMPMFGRWVVSMANAVLFSYLNYRIAPQHLDTWKSLFVYGALCSIIIFPILYLEFFLLFDGFKRFHNRIYGLVTRKIKCLNRAKKSHSNI